jgi:hypothetical protein
MAKTRGMNLFSLITYTLSPKHTARVEYDELLRERETLRFENRQLKKMYAERGLVVRDLVAERAKWRAGCGKAQAERAELARLAMTFCDRVEAGEVKSTKTYGAFCRALGREPKGAKQSVPMRAYDVARGRERDGVPGEDVMCNARLSHKVHFRNGGCVNFGCTLLGTVPQQPQSLQDDHKDEARREQADDAKYSRYGA